MKRSRPSSIVPILALMLVLGGWPSPSAAQSKAATASPSPSPSPQPVPEPTPVPPTPTQAAIDQYFDTFLATGELYFGEPPTDYPANVATAEPLPLADSTTYPILESLFQHRLTDPDDTIEGLIAEDPEVAQTYQTLRQTAQITTSAETDAVAVLHHLSLLRNGGTSGGFTVVGSSVISTGLSRPMVYTCYTNLGGLINWTYGRAQNNCNPAETEEARVSLQVRRPNGELYRATTWSNPCGTRSSFGFRSVPNGSAEVKAFLERRCCQSGQTNFQISCPPGPYSLLACIPPQSNQVVSVNMGPWNPPGVHGRVTGPGAAYATVWVGYRDGYCHRFASTSADSLGYFTVRGCLPEQPSIAVYAQGSNGYMGRVGIPNLTACGAAQGPITVDLAPLPKISGNILDWNPIYTGKMGGLARGCPNGGCSLHAMETITAPADSLGRYQLVLKPGVWSVGSYWDRGPCINQWGQSSRWACERGYGTLDLAPGAQHTINLLPAFNCSCP